MIKPVLSGTSHFLVKRMAGPFWARRQWLKRTERYDRHQLDQLQLQLLQRLVRHVHATVPWYRRLMDREGFGPHDIRSLADLQRFPVMTKADVLAAGEDLTSRSYGKWRLRTAYTGGTTGTPLRLRRSLFSIGNEHAFVRRQWDWAGIRMADRTAFLTGRLIAPPDRMDGQLYAYDPVMRELILSTYHLCPETADEYAQAMRHYQVKAVAGYPSAVHFLAKHCLASSREVQLRAALTSSETLTPPLRQTITAAFNCPVYDFYGSAERVCYIFTCEYQQYHVQPEYGITEFVPVEDAQDGTCRIVATGFWNPAMPLIRYDLGDLAVPGAGACECGRAFPVVKSIQGRQGEMVVTPSGRRLGAAMLTHLLYRPEHIVESQIIQPAADRLVIEYVPAEGFTRADRDALDEMARKHLPGELSVTLRPVKTCRRTASGKLRPVVSEV